MPNNSNPLTVKNTDLSQPTPLSSGEVLREKTRKPDWLRVKLPIGKECPGMR